MSVPAIDAASRAFESKIRSGPPVVGLLAAQGDFAKHRGMIERLGCSCREIRTPADLEPIDCLIMPGGESTTMRKLLKLEGLWEAIPDFARERAIMGTCAGLILLGRKIIDARDGEDTFGLLDVDTDRNAYGSQYHSFRQTGSAALTDGNIPLEMVFIRAPRLVRIGDGVRVLGHAGDEPTIVRQGHILAMTFHPELTDDTSVHEYFLSRVVRCPAT